LTGLPAEARGEEIGLLEDKVAVEKVQRLQGRVGAASLRHDLVLLNRQGSNQFPTYVATTASVLSQHRDPGGE